MKKLLVLILVLMMAVPLLAADTAMDSFTADASPDDEGQIIGYDTGVAMRWPVSAFQLRDATLTAVAGLTFADKSIIQLTGADAAAILTCANANMLIGVNAANDALECKSTINVQLDDSAAQFKSATASKGTMKFDQTGIADTKLITQKWTAAESYTFTPTLIGNTTLTIGTTFTNTKWCSYATATGLTCNENPGAGTGDVLADGTVPFTGAPIPSAANTVAIGSAAAEWADLYLGDASVIWFGNDQDVRIEHVADTGLLLSDAAGGGTTQLQFGDSGTYINQSADGTLNIVADTIAQVVAPNIKLAIDAAAYLNVAVANAGGATISLTSDGADSIDIGDNVDDEVRLRMPQTTANGTWSGITLEFADCAASLAFGTPVYVQSTGKPAAANADAAATMPAIGIIVVASTNADDPCTVLTHGRASATAWPSFTSGTYVYVDDSAAGVLTGTVGDIAGTDHVVQVIGIGLSGDTILVNPSFSTITLE